MRRVLCWVVLALAVVSLAARASVAQDTAPKRMKPALLVIDVQNAFLPYMAERDSRLVTLVINSAIELFRLYDYPVIRVYHTDPGWGPAPGSIEFEFPDSILVKPDDPKIVKNYPSGFKKTDLEKMLREMNRNAVFLCGLSATGCVLATYCGAQERDFDAFMIKDGLMSPDAAITDAVENFTDAVGYEALKVMLANAEK